MTLPDKGIGSAVEVTGLRVDIDGTTIVDAVSMTAAPGSLTAIVGPNGSGKSTLLRAVYRAGRPAAGTVLIGGRDVWRTPVRTVARERAVVTQHQGEAADFTVGEIVAMGRSPHKRFLETDSRADRKIVFEAMDRVGVTEFADRPFAGLSGGERQRVLLARALAQQASVILLDEPTNHLDIHAQLALLRLLRELDATIVLAIHDIGQALAYADHVVVLRDGGVVAAGEPSAVITPELLREVFQVSARIIENPITGQPHIIVGLPDEIPSDTANIAALTRES
ncbi:ABC transporter ATP-binding protein [Nocardia sp. NPDC051030]|uniref:ABC transporter ATP-binding protein n=1 Tax=Nocardia sp. NPDC051030 TaxID=3155162 RepID=UPI003437A53F